MTYPNHSPVSLPPGSFDFDKLETGLSSAVRGKQARYGDNVASALAAADQSAHEGRDARAIPGYKFVDVENQDLGVSERLQVFDHEPSEQEANDAISSGAPDNQATATAD